MNVLSPFVVTHASEYVPDIIKFIENGCAYESNLSVYFDTLKFNKEHPYPKLESERIDDIAALNTEMSMEAWQRQHIFRRH